MRNSERLLSTWLGDTLKDMNARLLEQGTCVVYALSGSGRGVGTCFSDDDCIQCISDYLNKYERRTDIMNLWHYKLIPVLPTSLLLKQWKDCITIAYNFSQDTNPNDDTIKHIGSYTIQQYRDYCNMILVELVKRSESINEATINALDSTIGFDIDSSVIHRDIFRGWHTNFYLERCVLNLTELHRMGSVTDDEFNVIMDFAKAYFGADI